MSLYRIARAAQRDLDETWCYIGSFDVRAADRWLGPTPNRPPLSQGAQMSPRAIHP